VGHFWQAGVNLSISSDDPVLMGATLTDELRSVVGVAGLTRADLAELQRRAARAAFLPPAERAALESRIDSWADRVAGDHAGRSAR
jgi:adenosine deaminase